MSENPYFQAVQVTTEEKAERFFNRLVRDVMDNDENLRRDPDHAKEVVVANLCYVAGYYDEGTRQRVSLLYSHRSPYRN